MTDELAQRIAALREKNKEYRERGESTLKRREKDQSLIAKIIVWSFVIAVAASFLLVFIFVFFDFAFAKQCEVLTECDYLARLEKPMEFLFRIISSVMLPVVTLVLGYYFGKEQVDNGS